MKLFWMTFLFIPTVWAGKTPIFTETSISDTAQIIERIQIDSMAKMKAKYSDIGTNYNQNNQTNGLKFDCKSNPTIINTSELNDMATFRVDNEKREMPDGLIETMTNISHFDCQGHLVFMERIEVVGKAYEPVDFTAVVKFVRHYQVLPKEKIRKYQIQNSEGYVLYSVASQRDAVGDGERIYTAIHVFGQKWADFEQADPSDNERRITIAVYPGIFRYKGSRYTKNFPNNLPYIFKVIWSEQRVAYYIQNDYTDLLNFGSILYSKVQLPTTEVLTKDIFEDLINLLPVTKQVKIPVADSKFLQDVKQNYDRVLNNNELDKVKDFLKKTRDDIKSGALKVEE